MDHSLLEAALQAQSENELQRADDLFRQHLQRERNDADGLAHYGMFCLHTRQFERACYYLAKAAHLLPSEPELVTQLGYAQLNNRDIEAAHQSFAAALTLAPADPIALNGVGLCQMQTGEPQEALRAFEQAGIDHVNSRIMINIADAYFQIGEHQRSFEYFEKVRSITPHDPAALLEYARCLRESGTPGRALLILDGLAPADRNAPLAILEAARCQRHAGNHKQATALLEQLNQLLPDTAEYYEEMGHCLKSDRSKRNACWETACTKWIENQQFAKAGELLDSMLEDSFDDAVVWNLRGIFLEATEEFELAEKALAKTLELDSECLPAYANLATLFEETNRLVEAREIAEAGLRLVARLKKYPARPYAELLLATCRVARRQKQYERAKEALDGLYDVEISAKQQEALMFERGKLLDLQANPRDAINAFSMAHEPAKMRWSESRPGPNRFLLEIESMLEFSAQGGLENWHKIDESITPSFHHKDPAFLIGFPRSGTTLLNQILDSNSFIQTIEEKPMLTRMKDAASLMPGGYPQVISESDQFDIAYLRDAYFKNAAQHCDLDSSKVLVDKFPLHIAKVALIHRVFPRARFIFSARHPCDVCLSCFMQNFRPNDAMANFFTLADTVALYVRTMELWQVYQDMLPISVHTVRYDAIVNDVEAESKKVCDFLGVPWQPNQADFAANALRRGKIHTPSYEQVSQPIYRSALGRWENYREFFQPYLPALQPYIDRYG